MWWILNGTALETKKNFHKSKRWNNLIFFMNQLSSLLLNLSPLAHEKFKRNKDFYSFYIIFFWIGQLSPKVTTDLQKFNFACGNSQVSITRQKIVDLIQREDFPNFISRYGRKNTYNSKLKVHNSLFRRGIHRLLHIDKILSRQWNAIAERAWNCRILGVSLRMAWNFV